MREWNTRTLVWRVVLALLTVYALAMIVPDLYRVVRPLGSFGLAANNDGLIYDVRGPFISETASPAWQAGIRHGDQLDLQAMRCIPVDTEICASMLALWGGLNYVMPGRTATLALLANDEHPARRVSLVAEPRPRSRILDLVLLLEQSAGILFVLGAAWLVWLRPGGMTWGFFAYAIEFNPGQAFQFWSWLQQWPGALLAQDVISCLMQAAGYTGFLLFALRVPRDHADGRWRKVEHALPVLALVFAVLSLSSLGSAFGHPTETVMRASLYIGFGVDIAALAILLARRKDLPPRDYQRLRWVIWGCLIGLPSFLLAQLTQITSLPNSLLGIDPLSEDIFGLFYLTNGILCLFVVEAVRRPAVVSVAIPLRRATMLGLLLSAPAVFLHRQMDEINELVHLPAWAWIVVASALAFLISRLHERATHLADLLFDRDFRRAETHLANVGQLIRQAESFADIERLLVEEPWRSLRLVAAALFREQDGTFARRASMGWDAVGSDTIVPHDDGLLDDLARPVLRVTVGDVRRCFAVALYSGHQDGTDLEHQERSLLEGLAHQAEIAYAQVESETLRLRVAELERQLAQSAAVA